MKLAGAPITRLSLQHACRGALSADATIAADVVPSGRVELEMPGLTLVGWVVGGGIWAQTCRVKLVGGAAGGVLKQVGGQHYRGATGGEIAQALVNACGEDLDPQSDPAATGQLLEHHQVRAGVLGLALDALCAALATDWQITAAGQVRLGVPTWPESSPAGVVVQEEVAARRELRLALEEPLLPGVTFHGRQIRAVDHEVEPGRWRAVARY